MRVRCRAADAGGVGPSKFRLQAEGAKRRQALVRTAAPVARLTARPVPAASGTPVHDADRRASRRSTAAILGFGTVLPGLGRRLFARPIAELSPRSSCPVQPLKGSPP